MSEYEKNSDNEEMSVGAENAGEDLEGQQNLFSENAVEIPWLREFAEPGQLELTAEPGTGEFVEFESLPDFPEENPQPETVEENEEEVGSAPVSDTETVPSEPETEETVRQESGIAVEAPAEEQSSPEAPETDAKTEEEEIDPLLAEILAEFGTKKEPAAEEPEVIIPQELPEEKQEDSTPVDASFEELEEEFEEDDSREEAEEDYEDPRSVSGSARKKIHPVWLVLCGLILVIGLAGILMYYNVYPVASYELGYGLPEASAFLRDGKTASYINPPEISLTEQKVYLLKIRTGLFPRFVALIVRDTQAPQAEDAHAVFTIDDQISPRDVITGVYDASEYMLSWVTPPQMGVQGSYEAEVELTDTYGNTRKLPVSYTIMGVKEYLEYEAGSNRPYASDFSNAAFTVAEYITNLDTITWDVPGDYPILLSMDGCQYESVLRIVDTIAPVFKLQGGMLPAGDSLNIEELVESCEDATAVTWELVSGDTANTGTQTFTIRATDLGGNTAEEEVEVIVCDKVLDMEASRKPLTRLMLLEQLGYSTVDETKTIKVETTNEDGTVVETEQPAPLEDKELLIPDHLGSEILQLDTGKETITVGIRLQDTVKPSAKAVAQTGFTGYKLEADDFISDLTDGTEVAVNFVNTPDWEKTGEQKVQLRLVDEAGNESLLETSLTLAEDTEVPVLYGTMDRVCYLNDTVDYTKAVFAVDNADNNVALTVDSSKVNMAKTGIYPVTYTAQDRNGNTITVNIHLTVLEKRISDEQLKTLTDEILSEIFTDGMTDYEKAKAVFDYINQNIKWKTAEENSDTTDWRSSAYYALHDKVGDSFGICSAQYLLLQGVNLDMMRVERINGASKHFWWIVNLGSGWYHYDACGNAPENYLCFMSTTEQLKQLSTWYWDFDEESYPTIETKPFEMEDKQQ